MWGLAMRRAMALSASAISTRAIVGDLAHKQVGDRGVAHRFVDGSQRQVGRLTQQLLLVGAVINAAAITHEWLPLSTQESRPTACPTAFQLIKNSLT